jgi:tRNA (cmo5U34)-methyltransferase
MVQSYDSLIRRAVPRYDEMIDRLLEHLPVGAGDAVSVLEMGCGTGNLTLRVGARLPRARVTTVDASPEMTAATGARWDRAGLGARLKTVTATFEAFEAPPGSFDLAVSCLSLHHVRDKASLYRSIASWLTPGSWLCLADQFLGATDAIQRAHWDLWRRFCRQPGHCTEEEIATLEAHAAAHDHYVPLVEHFRLLSSAGFEPGTMDCVWRNGMYGVLMARRA